MDNNDLEVDAPAPEDNLSEKAPTEPKKMDLEILKHSSETTSMGAIRRMSSEAIDDAAAEVLEDDKIDVEKLKTLKREEDEEDSDEVEEEDDSSEEEDEQESEAEGDSEESETGEAPKFKEREINVRSEDGEESKVSSNALVEIKVDGEVKTLRLQEVINRASGDMAVESRLKEVQKERATLQGEIRQKVKDIQATNERVDSFNETIKTISALATGGSPEELIVHCANLTGEDPEAAALKFFQDCSKYGQQFAQMSESEQLVWEDKIKTRVKDLNLTQKEKEIQAKVDAEAKKAENARIEKYANTEMEKAGVNYQDFETMVQTLDTSEVDFRKGADPESIVNTVLDYIHEDRVLKAAVKAGLNPQDPKDVETLKSTYRVTKIQGINTPEKLDELFSKLTNNAGSREEERIAKNLSKKVRKSSNSKKATTAGKKQDEENNGPFTLKDFRKEHHGF